MKHPVLFAAALIAGASYFFADAIVAGRIGHAIWKGSGVGLLAVWAAAQARSGEGRLLALAFAVYAAADVAIEFSTITGAAIFIAGHLAMIVLYLRHRRPMTSEDWMIAGLMLAAVPLAAFLLPDRRADGVQAALYAVALGAMATAALLSEFRPDRVLPGAMLFVVSDLLIFARLGALRDSAIPHLGIWPLYFAGQALIVTGVAQGLEARGR